MTIATLSTIILCGVGGATTYAFVSKPSDFAQDSNTIWNEMEINEGACEITPSYLAFNVDSLISDSDYIFSGTVINRKEYGVSWLDKTGEQWGPYPSSVIEVKINKNYYGNPPTEGETIKVYSPDSLSANIHGSLPLKEGYEYIFITQYLDDEFAAKKSSNDRFEQEKHANVYINNFRDNIINISNDDVAVYKEFFSNSNLISPNNIKEIYTLNDVINSNVVNDNNFVLIDKATFNNAFSSMINDNKINNID